LFKDKDIIDFAREFGIDGRTLLNKVDEMKHLLGISQAALIVEALKLDLRKQVQK
jgi:hypothetical protein